MVGSAVCGDMLRFQIRIKDDVITEAKFKTFGCGGAISASSLMTEKIIGRTVEDALKIKNKELVKELQLPDIKIHCSVMAEEAIAKAIENYKEKNK
jgi:nitrogen fixation NifU-like protein